MKEEEEKAVMQETYDLSREEMEALSERLRNPSREQLLRRQELLRALRGQASVGAGPDTETFEELDLSFLQRPFDYRQVQMSQEEPSLHLCLKLNGMDAYQSDVSYPGQDTDMTAA